MHINFFVDHAISPTSIQGRVGRSVMLTCMAPIPREAVNNILTIYRPEKDQFQSFRFSPDGEGRLCRTDSGVLTTYLFGPLRSSDNGTTLSCLFAGSQSQSNATIYVTCKSVASY